MREDMIRFGGREPATCCRPGQICCRWQQRIKTDGQSDVASSVFGRGRSSERTAFSASKALTSDNHRKAHAGEATLQSLERIRFYAAEASAPAGVEPGRATDHNFEQFKTRVGARDLGSPCACGPRESRPCRKTRPADVPGASMKCQGAPRVAYEFMQDLPEEGGSINSCRISPMRAGAQPI